MRFLIVDSIYEGFVDWLYNRQVPGLASKSFEEQYNTQVNAFFHSASAWAAPLRALGHEVLDVSCNNAAMQLRWMMEHDRFDVAKTLSDGLLFGRQVFRQKNELGWHRGFVAEQVRTFRPDVLLIADLYTFDDRFLTEVAGSYGKAIGQHAAVMPRGSYKRYDLVISSLPNQVQEFIRHGIRAEVVRLAFDERLLPHLEDRGKPHDVAFLGQISQHHRGRAEFIAEVARHLPVDFWGTSVWPEGIDPTALKLRTHTPLWGLPMYQTLRDCRMVLNYHLDAAGQFANNLRLFEVTGVGSLLVTDNKVNIRDYFEPGAEIIAYDDSADCVRKVQYLLAQPEEAQRMAAAAQARVLAEHTYAHRTQELLALLG